ncbi:MAG: SUMF1/EgtB/PvdO family nonheme iron enzyme [Planctomycetota bacterium]
MKHFMLVLLLASALCCRGEETPAGRKYALLIGVQRYDGSDLGNLKFCENDVDELAAVLKGPAYNYNRVTLLTRTEALKNIDRDDILPTAENIRAHLKGVLSDRKAYDTVLVAFAGHGIQLKLDGKMYFCPAKCNLNKRESLICIDEIYAELGKTKANSKILLVDACRDDPLSKRGTDERINSLTMPLIPDPPGGTVAMFSCCKGQSARENEKYKHGYLFKYLIDGMNGNPQVKNPRSGEVTWLKLAGFVAEEVKDQVKEDYGPEVLQTPEVKGESIDLVLGRLEPKPVAPPPNSVIATRPPENGNELTIDLGSGVKMELVRIKAGSFLMGSPESEPERLSSREKQHRVTISKDFYMGKYAVTQEQYEAVMGTNPSYFTKEKGGPKHPVEQVSWEDAVEFCKKLSTRSGKTIALPSEAQWEYACRAGTTTPFNFEGPISSDKVNYDATISYDGSAKGLYRQKTTPVGTFAPNKWGLYDMHGNVYQLCADLYKAEYETLSATDPLNNSDGTARVLRGGSWNIIPNYCRSAYRFYYTPFYRSLNIGFRIVLPLDL